LLEVSHLSKQYLTPRGPIPVLSDISLSVSRGDAAAIMGPSGSGKSTLLYILGALDAPTSGSVTLDGTIVRMAVLHGVLQISREGDGIVAMPPVQAISAARALRVGHEGRAIVEVSELNSAVTTAKIPGSVEIILGAGAHDRGFSLIIDEYHIIALSHPMIGVLQHAERNAH